MPGTAQQGFSAALVYSAINQFTDMLNDADAKMVSAVDTEINAALKFLPSKPGTNSVAYSDPYYAVKSALRGANLNVTPLEMGTLPPLIDDAVGGFFSDYGAQMDKLFPGLGSAAADAKAFAQAALYATATYSEQVDSTPAETAFKLARRQAWAQERETLEAAARAGHRFAPGQVLEGLARMHAGSLATATEALQQAHARRVQEERVEKMRLARAMLGSRMELVKKLHAQTAEAFRLKMQARGLWINDQNAVVDAVNKQYVLPEKFQAHLYNLMRRTATWRFGLAFDEAATRDRDDFLGKLKMANANEVVDLFGAAVTTLMNQVQGRASYQGSERDVTDWDTLMG